MAVYWSNYNFWQGCLRNALVRVISWTPDCENWPQKQKTTLLCSYIELFRCGPRVCQIDGQTEGEGLRRLTTRAKTDLSICKMTMTSFAITLYGQCCRRHVVSQRVVNDVSIVRSCWSIYCLCVDAHNINLLL